MRSSSRLQRTKQKRLLAITTQHHLRQHLSSLSHRSTRPPSQIALVFCLVLLVCLFCWFCWFCCFCGFFGFRSVWLVLFLLLFISGCSSADLKIFSADQLAYAQTLVKGPISL